jgi:hypothetical protein
LNTLFLDTEFTALTQNAQLISLALVDETGTFRFYAEFTDYDPDSLSDWHLTHVIPHLTIEEPGLRKNQEPFWELKGDTEFITPKLKDWLHQFDSLEIWCDCPTYDWVLFCELFGGALHLPKHIYYLPFDLVTLFKARGMDPDTNRRDFSEIDLSDLSAAHNALSDALVTRACYLKLMDKKPTDG